MKPIGVFNNEELYLRISKYRNNNRIYIGIETKDEPYADLTINLPDMMISSREYVFVSGDISEELKDFLKEKGLILDTFGTYQYNYAQGDVHCLCKEKKCTNNGRPLVYKLVMFAMAKLMEMETTEQNKVALYLIK